MLEGVLAAAAVDVESGSLRELWIHATRIDSEAGLGLEEHADYEAGQQQKQYHTGGYGDLADIEGQEVGNYLVRGKAVHLYGLAEAVAQHPAHFAV